ncbi:hypothetical protein, partial [Piscirickettsia litoralis]|uniref:hypothetical protein n=1 Tax=Piscirickettsia litoralis TaxID=1891921 RepID=UPI00130132AF
MGKLFRKDNAINSESESCSSNNQEQHKGRRWGVIDFTAIFSVLIIIVAMVSFVYFLVPILT